MNILAIDLGKFNSMCCFFETDTQKYRFQAVATTRQYLTAVFKNHKIDLVVMEACGPSGWINDLCLELGLKTLVCSTSDEAWRWKNVKRKTDKDDSLKLARMAMMRQLTPVHIPSHTVREHRTRTPYENTARSSSIARSSLGVSTRSRTRFAVCLFAAASKLIEANQPGEPVENSSIRIEGHSSNVL